MFRGYGRPVIVIYSIVLQIYDKKELLMAKLDILSKTNMVDYAIDIRRQLYSTAEVPEVCRLESLFQLLYHFSLFHLCFRN